MKQRKSKQVCSERRTKQTQGQGKLRLRLPSPRTPPPHIKTQGHSATHRTCLRNAGEGEALRLVMQVCKRLERSKPAKRQATVQGSDVCTLHYTGVAQTSGSSEHPGPCLSLSPCPLPAPRQHPRHGGSSHVSGQGPHSSLSASSMAPSHDTTALSTMPGDHASHTINKRERGGTRDNRPSSTQRLQFAAFIFPQQIGVVDCCTVCRHHMPSSAVGTATAKP